MHRLRRRVERHRSRRIASRSAALNRDSAQLRATPDASLRLERRSDAGKHQRETLASAGGRALEPNRHRARKRDGRHAVARSHVEAADLRLQDRRRTVLDGDNVERLCQGHERNIRRRADCVRRKRGAFEQRAILEAGVTQREGDDSAVAARHDDEPASGVVGDRRIQFDEETREAGVVEGDRELAPVGLGLREDQIRAGEPVRGRRCCNGADWEE